MFRKKNSLKGNIICKNPSLLPSIVSAPLCPPPSSISTFQAVTLDLRAPNTSSVTATALKHLLCAFGQCFLNFNTPRTHPRIPVKMRVLTQEVWCGAPGSAFSSHVTLPAAVPLCMWVLELIGFWPGIPYMTAVSRQEAMWEFDDLMKSAPDTWGQWRGAEKLCSMNWPPWSGPSQCSHLVGGHAACWKGPTWFLLCWELPSLSPLGWLSSKLVLTISKTTWFRCQHL